MSMLVRMRCDFVSLGGIGKHAFVSLHLYDQIVESAVWMRPSPRCIHSSGATRSSALKIWSLYIENAQLSTSGRGRAVIALSSFPVVATNQNDELAAMDDRQDIRMILCVK